MLVGCRADEATGKKKERRGINLIQIKFGRFSRKKE